MLDISTVAKLEWTSMTIFFYLVCGCVLKKKKKEKRMYVYV